LRARYILSVARTIMRYFKAGFVHQAGGAANYKVLSATIGDVTTRLSVGC
jgi:hypothetical protein